MTHNKQWFKVNINLERKWRNERERESGREKTREEGQGNQFLALKSEDELYVPETRNLINSLS